MMQKIPWSIIMGIKNHDQILKGFPEQNDWATIYWVHTISWKFTICFSNLMDVIGTGKLHLENVPSFQLGGVLNTNLSEGNTFQIKQNQLQIDLPI